jgi:hypothetical protein
MPAPNTEMVTAALDRGIRHHRIALYDVLIASLHGDTVKLVIFTSLQTEIPLHLI